MPWAKILRSGQVTLPKEVRERLNLKEGDILDFEITEDGVMMRAKGPRPPDSKPLARP